MVIGRNSIVIFGIIMSFIIGSIVSLPSAAAPEGGAALLAEEMEAIQEIIAGMQDQLSNIRVAWVNVTHVPSGFTNDTFTGGIFQGNTSAIAEPCQAGDAVTWNGNQWVCLQASSLWENIQNKPSGFADDIDNDTLSEISTSCQTDQIAEWDGTNWVCAAVPSGTGGAGGMSFGPEVVVLDNSGFDDGTAGHRIVLSGSGATAGAEFTLPTTAGAYRISAIEVKMGTGVFSVSTPLCAGVFETQGNTLLPLASGNWLAINQVASARSGINADGSADIIALTVHKLPAVSAIIEGGKELIVFFKSCGNSFTTFTGDVATNAWTVTASDPMNFSPGPSIGTTATILVEKTGIDYYVKVYAVPLQ